MNSYDSNTEIGRLTIENELLKIEIMEAKADVKAWVVISSILGVMCLTASAALLGVI